MTGPLERHVVLGQLLESMGRIYQTNCLGCEGCTGWWLSDRECMVAVMLRASLEVVHGVVPSMTIGHVLDCMFEVAETADSTEEWGF